MFNAVHVKTSAADDSWWLTGQLKSIDNGTGGHQMWVVTTGHPLDPFGKLTYSKFLKWSFIDIFIIYS